MDPEIALANARDVLALWYVDRRGDGDLIRPACDLLVAGFDGDSLRRLAAASIRHPGGEVEEVLADAWAEVGIPVHPRESDAAAQAALTAMAAEFLRGSMTSRHLTTWVHRRFGHESEFARGLAELDDVYDEPGLSGVRAAEVHALVEVEARRIVAQGR